MPMTDTTELRRLAERAVAMPHDGGLRVRAVRDLYGAATPEAIIALLDELDALRAVEKAAREVDDEHAALGKDLGCIPCAHLTDALAAFRESEKKG